MKNIYLFTLLIVCAITCSAQQYKTEVWAWQRVTSEYGDIEMPEQGREMSDLAIADFNQDGTTDFVISESGIAPSLMMFIKQKDSWKKFIIEKRLTSIQSLTTADIDGDGDIDIVGGGKKNSSVWWWENPGKSKLKASRPWKRYYIQRNGENMHSNIIAGDFNNDQVLDIVYWNQGQQSLIISSPPENLKKAKSWSSEVIYKYGIYSQQEQLIDGMDPELGINYHQGLDKYDIDNDGVEDILAAGMWFKYADSTFIPCDIDKRMIGSKIKAGQIIPGGRAEVVMAPAHGTGPVMMYEYDRGTWIGKEIYSGLSHVHCLDIVDIDENTSADILIGETKFSKEQKASAFILTSYKGAFRMMPIGNGLGYHNSKFADLDGDGDYDIVSKPLYWDVPKVEIYLNKGKR